MLRAWAPDNVDADHTGVDIEGSPPPIMAAYVSAYFFSGPQFFETKRLPAFFHLGLKAIELSNSMRSLMRKQLRALMSKVAVLGSFGDRRNHVYMVLIWLIL